MRTDGASGKTACALVTLAFALATGCVGGQSHPYELAETQLGAPGVERVLLLPLNTLSELPRELDGSTRRVTRHIRSHLEACGVEITPMGLVEARGVWAELDEVAGDPGEARVARFARRLHEGGDVDAVVLPSLVVREARIQAVTRRVEWDGVRRQLEVKGHLDKHGSGSISQMNVRGDMPVISLHLAVYDPNGVRVFDSLGGLDLIHQIRVTPVTRQNLNQRVPLPTWEWQMKRKRLADDAALAEGVAMAFDPYLVPPAAAAAAAAAGGASGGTTP